MARLSNYPPGVTGNEPEINPPPQRLRCIHCGKECQENDEYGLSSWCKGRYGTLHVWEDAE